MKKFLQNTLGRFLMLSALLLTVTLFTGNALATGDDIDTTITTLSGYWTAIETLAIAVVLFVIGRRIIRKI